ncbi:O-Antigen ligase [Crateriforma conspicua]|uniref:O-Antigen ligase n=2 Tax=Crateriforma conspicua TaxID=2527996 RepID=A0A5C6FRK7_9PLAN|nr:O-Antigen ligase [Crateriforma conspicua]
MKRSGTDGGVGIQNLSLKIFELMPEALADVDDFAADVSGGCRGWPRRLLWASTALAIFVGPVDIVADGGTMTVGLDPVVAVKLGTALIAMIWSAWGLATCRGVRELVLSMPALLLFGILFLVLLATPRAVSSASAATALINTTYVVFIATSLVGLGIRGTVSAMTVGMFVYTCCAWGLYLTMPRYGVFPEDLGGGLIVYRLGGMGHPNGVSRAICLGLILSVWLWKSGRIPTRWFALVAPVFAVAAYLAWSRTSLVATAIALLILWADQILRRRVVAAITVLAMVGITTLTVVWMAGYGESIAEIALSKLTKTGSTEELTTGTGRAEIWAYSIDLIRQRPWIGHGFNAGPTLLERFSQSTHNAVLHASLAGGVVAGGFMVVLLIVTLNLVLTGGHPLIRAVAFFVLISCLLEETVLETFPGPCTLTWLMCLFYPTYAWMQRHNREASDLANRRQAMLKAPTAGISTSPSPSH